MYLALKYTSHTYLLHARLFFQIVNKGLVSYRDPDSAPGRGTKTLHVTGDMNLTKMFSKAVRELKNPQVRKVLFVKVTYCSSIKNTCLTTTLDLPG